MSFVGKITQAAQKVNLASLNQDLDDMFKGNKAKFLRLVRKLGEAFGKSASIEDVYTALSSAVAPTKTFDGIEYVAGNSWPHMVAEGYYDTARLLEVTTVKNNVKLCFGIEDKYLYKTYKEGELTATRAIEYTKLVGSYFAVQVEYDYVEAIDENKAVVRTIY